MCEFADPQSFADPDGFGFPGQEGCATVVIVAPIPHGGATRRHRLTKRKRTNEPDKRQEQTPETPAASALADHSATTAVSAEPSTAVIRAAEAVVAAAALAATSSDAVVERVTETITDAIATSLAKADTGIGIGAALTVPGTGLLDALAPSAQELARSELLIVTDDQLIMEAMAIIDGLEIETAYG